MSTNSDTHHDASTYYSPHGSPWPILGSVALFSIMLGAVSVLNGWAGGWSFIPGAAMSGSNATAMSPPPAPLGFAAPPCSRLRPDRRSPPAA